MSAKKGGHTLFVGGIFDNKVECLWAFSSANKGREL